MRYSEIYIAQKKLDNLFALASSLPADPEIRSHWAKYLCVLVSGFLETAVAAIYVDFAQRKSHRHIVNYVSSEIEFFTNPNMSKIVELAGEFNPEWASELEETTGGEIKEAIDSVRSNRNQIAHGEYSGITIGTITRFYAQVTKLVIMIDKQCHG